MRLLQFHAGGVAVAAILSVLSACAPIDRGTHLISRGRVQPLGQCETVVGHGTSVSRSYARAIAEAGVRQEVADARGALLVSGLRRIRAEPAEVTCRPYILGGGLTQCTASRRFCGR